MSIDSLSSLVSVSVDAPSIGTVAFDFVIHTAAFDAVFFGLALLGVKRISEGGTLLDVSVSIDSPSLGKVAFIYTSNALFHGCLAANAFAFTTNALFHGCLAAN